MTAEKRTGRIRRAITAPFAIAFVAFFWFPEWTIAIALVLIVLGLGGGLYLWAHL